MKPLLDRDAVHERLQTIFPDGAPNRVYLTRMLAASTVFVALYIEAIEGGDTLLGPKHIYRMTDEQAALTDDDSRAAYATGVLRPGSAIEGQRWYQDNTREPIRDIEQAALCLDAGLRRAFRSRAHWRRSRNAHQSLAQRGSQSRCARQNGYRAPGRGHERRSGARHFP